MEDKNGYLVFGAGSLGRRRLGRVSFSSTSAKNSTCLGRISLGHGVSKSRTVLRQVVLPAMNANFEALGAIPHSMPHSIATETNTRSGINKGPSVIRENFRLGRLLEKGVLDQIKS